jgi:hypothetical protein
MSHHVAHALVRCSVETRLDASFAGSKPCVGMSADAARTSPYATAEQDR